MSTVKDVYERTKALMFEKASSNIYDDKLIPNLNRLLVELFYENNVCRVFNGKGKLKSPQVVSNQGDEMIYEDEYVDNVIPLGLATRFLIDDDLNKYAIFNTDYNNARVSTQKLVSREKWENASETSA